MPLITIELDPSSETMKKELIHRLSKEASEITKKPIDHFIVYVKEFPHENIGVGGKTVKELISG